MNHRLRKQDVIIIILVISLLLNTFQFFKLEKHTRLNHYADNEFMIGLKQVCHGIELLETKKIDELAGMALLSSGTSKAVSLYILTSYYKENPDLYHTLEILDNNINNKTNIREVLEKNDLTLLIPGLEKVIIDPYDKNDAEELDYLVKKHTVIGSPLK